ncbi:hypothetical protein Dimus_038669 [Dionaea muscipula]
MVPPLRQTNVGIVIRDIDLNTISTRQVPPLRQTNVGIIIHDIDLNAVYIRQEQENGKEKTLSKGKGKAVSIGKDNAILKMTTTVLQISYIQKFCYNSNFQ